MPSRAKMIRDAKLPVPVPDMDHYLAETIQSLGWVSPGPAPLPAAEIKAWAECTGETLTPWEFETVRMMSQAFIGGANSAQAPFQPMIVKMAVATAAFMQQSD